MASAAQETSGGEASGWFNARRKGRRTSWERKRDVVGCSCCSDACRDFAVVVADVVVVLDESLEDSVGLFGDLDAPARRTAATYRVWRERRWTMARSEASFTPL